MKPIRAMTKIIFIAAIAACSNLYAQYVDTDPATRDESGPEQSPEERGEALEEAKQEFYPPRVEPYEEHLEQRGLDELGAEQEAVPSTSRRDQRTETAQREKTQRLQDAREELQKRVDEARQKRKTEFGVEGQFGARSGEPENATARVLNAMRRETIRYRYRIARLIRAKQVMLDKNHDAVARRLDAMLDFESALFKIRMGKLKKLDEEAAAQFDPSRYRLPSDELPDPGRALADLDRDIERPTPEIMARLKTERQMKDELAQADELDPEALLDMGTDPDRPPPERDQ